MTYATSPVWPGTQETGPLGVAGNGCWQRDLVRHILSLMKFQTLCNVVRNVLTSRVEIMLVIKCSIVLAAGWLNDCPAPDQVQYLILLSCCQVQYLILFVLLNLPFFGLKNAFPSSLNPTLPCIPWLNWMEGCCGANLSGQKNSVAFRLGTRSSLRHRDNASDPSWRKQTSECRQVVREGWAWRSLCWT